MFKRGKVILVPFPFTDLSAQKVRPAVIISDPKRVKENVIVAFITSKPSNKSTKAWVKMTEGTTEFTMSGLKINSTIRCDKLATLDKRIVLGEVGEINSGLMKTIDSAIRFSLSLK